MRLINANTLELEEFFGKQRPKYAILSHRWESDEVSLQNFQAATQTETAGFAKIRHTCAQTLKSDLSHVWIDTCCIDKTNSVELSEAINLMFRWYEEASVCFAYLADVPPMSRGDIHDEAFRGSRWFTRGWTLQELLAPKHLVFFASNWSIIADRHEMASLINEVTNIQKVVLEDPWRQRDTCNWSDIIADPDFTPVDGFSEVIESRQSKLRQVSVAEKMSWAANRVTTRDEDIAYCLLGIFDINMPLMYGEGMRAFTRLQKEIIQQLSDPTILAWNSLHDNKALPIVKEPPCSAWRLVWGMLVGMKHPWYHDRPVHLAEETSTDMNILAPSPKVFASSHQLIPVAAPELALTTKSLNVSLPLSEDRLLGRLPFASAVKVPSLLLPCRPRGDPWSLVSLPLVSLDSGVYGRLNAPIQLVSHRKWSMWPRKSVDLLVHDSKTIDRSPLSRQKLWIRNLSSNLRLTDVQVRKFDRWTADDQIIELRPSLTDLRDDCAVDTVFALVLVECKKSRQRFSIVLDVWQPPYLFPGFWWINHHFVPFDSIVMNTKVHAVLKSLNSYTAAKFPKYEEDCDGIIHAHITYEHIFGEKVCALDITHTSNGYRAKILKIGYEFALLLRKGANYVLEVVCYWCYAFGDVLPCQICLSNIGSEIFQRFDASVVVTSAGLYMIWVTYRLLPSSLISSTRLSPKIDAERTVGNGTPQRSPSPGPSAKPIVPSILHFFSAFYMLIPIVAYILPSSSRILRSGRAILSLLLSLMAGMTMYEYPYVGYGVCFLTMCTQYHRFRAEWLWKPFIKSPGFHLSMSCVFFFISVFIRSGWLKVLVPEEWQHTSQDSYECHD